MKDQQNEDRLIASTVPVPDPTVLTTRNLQREIFGLRELLEAQHTADIAKLRELIELRIESHNSDMRAVKEVIDARFATEQLDREGVRRHIHGLREILETRLDGMDKAIALRQSAMDHAWSHVDEKIAAVQAVQEQRVLNLSDTYGERFNSIQMQFKERDVRTDQSSKDSKVAVDAALQAAKEAVGEQNKSSALAISKSEASITKQIDQLGQQIQAITKASDDKFTDVKERLTRIEGGSQGGKAMWGYVAAGFGFLLTLLTIGALVFDRADRTPSAAAQPQVIYVPAPTGTLVPAAPPVTSSK